jgi:heme oxygenase
MPAVTKRNTPDSQPPSGRITPISRLLREKTSEHHERTEGSEFLRLLVGGSLPVDAYAAWLGQMLCIYRTLESQLGGPTAHAEHASLLTESRRRTPELVSDIRTLGLSPDDFHPVAPAAAFLDRLLKWGSRGSPALVGVLYVLEGSTNGSRRVARALREAYGLGPMAGISFLDPYGGRQSERWRAFRAELDARTSRDELPEILAGAWETFDAVAAIGHVLLQKHRRSPGPGSV